MAALSFDAGKTWPARRLLEDDPQGMYCYTAIHFVEDAALLGYFDFRGLGDQGANRLRLRRVRLDWLRAAAPGR